MHAYHALYRFVKINARVAPGNNALIVFVLHFCSDGVVADLPYGVTDEKWDMVPTKEWLTKVLNQISAVNKTGEAYTAFWWCHYKHMGMISEVLALNQHSSIVPYFWHKTGFNVVGYHQAYLSSVETAIVSFYGGIHKAPKGNMPVNPTLRHNFSDGPHVTKKRISNKDHKVLNETEKPHWFMKAFGRRHWLPTSTIVVIGAGAGGDLLGLIEAGLNVIGIEPDPRQFFELQAAVLAKVAEMRSSEKKNSEPAVDDVPVHSSKARTKASAQELLEAVAAHHENKEARLEALKTAMTTTAYEALPLEEKMCFLCEKGYEKEDDVNFCPNCAGVSMHEKCGVLLSEEEIQQHKDAMEPGDGDFNQAYKCLATCAFNIHVYDKTDSDVEEEVEV
jgi:hypothetical protein